MIPPQYTVLIHSTVHGEVFILDNMNIYEDIGKRTGGDVYIGVVGPVRAGKSTFIKRFMDLMVIPNVKDVYEKERILDEMPQSGTGKTITTTEPKFIPADAVQLDIEDGLNLKVRLVDCVGYIVPEAAGFMEDGRERMVNTPWADDRMLFSEAAEKGTEKVIKDHSTIGIVVTSDGSIGTVSRSSYEEAERRMIEQLSELRKPFAVILNSVEPKNEKTLKLAHELEENYGVPVVSMDCMKASNSEISSLMGKILGRFPVKEISFEIPGYIESLDSAHWLKSELIENIRCWAQTFDTVEELKRQISFLADGEIVESADIENSDMGTGQTNIKLSICSELYYRVITELMEEEVRDDRQFFDLLKEFSEAKKEYDKLKSAMQQVNMTGYGIVEPRLDEMELQEPEVFKQGDKYGVRITAKAPTLHIIRTDITTEVSPVVGSEKQSEDLVESFKDELENSPNGIWDTNIFGKSLYEMVAEQMENKIAGVPENIRVKVQRSLQKISDDGKEYFICIVI